MALRRLSLAAKGYPSAYHDSISEWWIVEGLVCYHAVKSGFPDFPCAVRDPQIVLGDFAMFDDCLFCTHTGDDCDLRELLFEVDDAGRIIIRSDSLDIAPKSTAPTERQSTALLPECPPAADLSRHHTSENAPTAPYFGSKRPFSDNNATIQPPVIGFGQQKETASNTTPVADTGTLAAPTSTLEQPNDCDPAFSTFFMSTTNCTIKEDLYDKWWQEEGEKLHREFPSGGREFRRKEEELRRLTEDKMLEIAREKRQAAEVYAQVLDERLALGSYAAT